MIHVIDQDKKKVNTDLVVESLRNHINTLEEKNATLNEQIETNDKKIEELKKEIQNLTN